MKVALMLRYFLKHIELKVKFTIYFYVMSLR